MKRREFLRKLLAAGAGALFAGAGGRAFGARGRPNILFIMTDQHRLDAMGAYGNRVIRTPNLDKLASQGMRFTHYYIAAFPCSPSRASILTGRYAERHGVIQNNIKLDENIPTLGTELSRAGYRTAWVGKWHLGGPWKYEPPEQPGTEPRLVRIKRPPGERMPQNGFQEGTNPGRDYIAYLRRLGLEEPRPGKKVRGGHHTVIENGHSVIPAEHHVEAFLTDAAIGWLERYSQLQQRFCLCVSYLGPHRPMTPPQPWDRMYDPDKLPLPPTVHDPMIRAPRTHREFVWRMYGRDLAKDRQRLKRAIVFEGEMWDLLDRPKWTDREFRELMAHYYGYISYIDQQIGRLLHALDSLGLAENTIVVYTTDHGEFMGGHGCIFKGYMMYDDLVRAPLMVRWPGHVPEGKVSDALVSSVDLMPTLLDLAGVAAPAGADGRSFRSLLLGRSSVHRDAIFSAFTAKPIQTRMIRTQRWKYCLNFRPRQRDELYDLQADPNEMNNLSGLPDYEAVERKLRRRVLEHMQQIGDPWFLAALATTKLPRLTQIRFDFNSPWEIGYWSFYRGISGAHIEGGCLTGKIECPGYMVAELDEPASGDDYPRLEIRMAATAGRWAQFYWATEDRPQMCEAMSVRIPIVADGKLHSYTVDLSHHPLWRGKRITQIRLNPVRRCRADKALTAQWRIDYIGPPREGKR